MFDIFISYAREDVNRVKELVNVLEKRGWSVFWDRRIPAGKTWRSHIGNALEHARCIVVIWSQYSTGSDWVNEEADEGKKRGILIPILLDSVQPPHCFREIQAADLTGHKFGQASEIIDNLFADIAQLLMNKELSAEPHPAPEPQPHNPEINTYTKREQSGSVKFITKYSKLLIAIVVLVIVLVVVYFSVQNDRIIIDKNNIPHQDFTQNGEVKKSEDHPAIDITSANEKPQWLVIVGAFPLTERKAAEERGIKYKNYGFDVTSTLSNDFPMLKPDLIVIFLGPFEREEEAFLFLRRVKQKEPDAYVKQGR